MNVERPTTFYIVVERLWFTLGMPKVNQDEQAAPSSSWTGR